MKYMGSKRRVWKQLLPIILKDRKEDQYYVEPFCGGCNMIEHVTGKRIASDSNFYLIEMFKKLVYENWLPPQEISEEFYNKIKNNKEIYDPALVSFVGFGCSFGSKFLGCFARGRKTINYAQESYSSLLKQKYYLHGVKFFCKNYIDLDIPSKSIIYCDPPYHSVTGYKDKINHNEFWQWCRDKSREHKIFISEYSAPDDFKCLIEIPLICNVDNKNNRKLTKIEKLFTYEAT
jgi:DNA adenine methylase